MCGLRAGSAASSLRPRPRFGNADAGGRAIGLPREPTAGNRLHAGRRIHVLVCTVGAGAARCGWRSGDTRGRRRWSRRRRRDAERRRHDWRRLREGWRGQSRPRPRGRPWGLLCKTRGRCDSQDRDDRESRHPHGNLLSAIRLHNVLEGPKDVDGRRAARTRIPLIRQAGRGRSHPPQRSQPPDNARRRPRAWPRDLRGYVLPRAARSRWRLPPAPQRRRLHCPQ